MVFGDFAYRFVLFSLFGLEGNGSVKKEKPALCSAVSKGQLRVQDGFLLSAFDLEISSSEKIAPFFNFLFSERLRADFFRKGLLFGDRCDIII